MAERIAIKVGYGPVAVISVDCEGRSRVQAIIKRSKKSCEIIIRNKSYHR